MTINIRMCTTAIAAALSLPLTLSPAWAQSQEAGQSGTTTMPSQGTPPAQDAQQSGTTPPPDMDQAQNQQQQQPSSPSADAPSGSQGDAAANALVATVGGAEIRGSDVLTVIGMLPPQLQSQSPQMLVPIALEQLILHELILERARSQNLAEDPEVVNLVTGATQTAQDDAMVQVWLDRELAKSVTEDAVQKSYDEAQQAQGEGQEDFPQLEAVRPQIKQHLRRQAVEALRVQLREGADIVLYDPTGRPLAEAPQATQDGAGSGDAAGSPDPSASSDAGNGTDGASAEGGAASASAASDMARSQAEQSGMQAVEPMQGATILKGKSATNADVYMIVGPSGELLALASPLPAASGTGSAQSEDGSATPPPPEAGEPAQSGFMATQAQPATPGMWDPASVEHGMRQLELGIRGAAGEVTKP